jgi:hypothetical protein
MMQNKIMCLRIPAIAVYHLFNDMAGFAPGTSHQYYYSIITTKTPKIHTLCTLNQQRYLVIYC